jgi:hypothetical protein
MCKDKQERRKGTNKIQKTTNNFYFVSRFAVSILWVSVPSVV